MAEKAPNELTLTNVRLAFTDLREARSSVKDSEPKFGCNFLIDPATKEGKALIKRIEAAQAWCEDGVFKGKEVTYKDGRNCFVDGDDCVSQKNGEVYRGFEGMKVVKAKSKKRPHVLNRSKQPVNEGEQQCPYAGCYVDGLVRFFCVTGKEKGGNGFFCELIAVRFRTDGEAFGSTVDIDGAFEDLDDEDLV